MTAQLVAVVDRAERSLAGLRAIGTGPYLLVDDAASSEATLEALLARHRVLTRLTAERACLPCRFGDTLPDDAAALAWLAARGERVASALARVVGRWELDLRLRADAAGPTAEAGGGPGTRYLRRVAARHTRVDPIVLDEVARRAREALPEAAVVVDAEAGCVAFLVGAADVAAALATARARGVDASLPEGVAASWSGPWPAYTFAAAWLGEAA